MGSALAQLLAEHYRLLALDFIGTGDSDKPQLGFRPGILYLLGLGLELLLLLI